MKLKKNVFILLVAVMLGLYGVANATLWHKRGGFTFFEDDLFVWMTSIFLFMILLILPRTVEILLGSETQPSGNGINDDETSDSEQPH
jgi:hypothetical protein